MGPWIISLEFYWWVLCLSRETYKGSKGTCPNIVDDTGHDIGLSTVHTECCVLFVVFLSSTNRGMR